MQDKEKIKYIINELKKINKKDQNLERAIEYLKKYLYNIQIIGSEGNTHNLIRYEIIKYFEGSIYHESENTGFSKDIGFRPDIIILNDKELIIIEIETNKKRAKSKLNIINNKFDIIKKHYLSNQRKIRIVFCFSFYDKELFQKIKEKKYEIYFFEKNKLIKI